MLIHIFVPELKSTPTLLVSLSQRGSGVEGQQRRPRASGTRCLVVVTGRGAGRQTPLTVSTYSETAGRTGPQPGGEWAWGALPAPMTVSLWQQNSKTEHARLV